MRIVMLLAACAALSAQAQTRRHEWTRYPLLTPVMGRGLDRAKALVRPIGLVAPQVRVYAADGPADRRQVDYAVSPEGARIETATPAIGNYHWVVAREESETLVRVASTAWYFGNPGPAPTTLLKTTRHELEIVPEPLPREHAAYRESEKWRFQVRFNGAPLPEQPVALETEFGSRSVFVTDAAGYATVLFPRDFRSASPDIDGRDSHGSRRAKFVLATERDGDGKRFLTAFNYVYGQDADRDKRPGWGIFFGVLGMATATPLLRRRFVKTTGGGNV